MASSHHAIAEILRDMPAETLDGLRRRSMVAGDDLSPLLRVEMASYLGRADQITEKHRQMPPLARQTVAWFRLSPQAPRLWLLVMMIEPRS